MVKLRSLTILLGIFAAGCTDTVRVGEGRGRPTHYEDPNSPGAVSGVGLESQDIVSMTDRMVRDILANPKVAARTTTPRIIVDSEFFRNESSSVINKNLLTDRLRTELSRAANGRLVFIARHAADMTEQERALEEEGVVTGGTQGKTKPSLGYDYRLGGRIASLDAVNTRSGMQSRYHQITFELIERGSSVLVWSNQYEIRKAALDDIVYR